MTEVNGIQKGVDAYQCVLTIQCRSNRVLMFWQWVIPVIQSSMLTVVKV